MWSFALQTNYVATYRADLVTFALEPTLENVPVTVRKQRDPRSPHTYQHYKCLRAHMKVEGLLAPVRSSDAHPLTNGVRTETIKWLTGTCATPWLVGGDLNTSSWHIQRTCPSAAIIGDAAPNLARRDIAFHHALEPNAVRDRPTLDMRPAEFADGAPSAALGAGCPTAASAPPQWDIACAENDAHDAVPVGQPSPQVFVAVVDARSLRTPPPAAHHGPHGFLQTQHVLAAACALPSRHAEHACSAERATTTEAVHATPRALMQMACMTPTP